MKDWLSVSDLAKARGVSKVAISRIISRWRDMGTPVPTRKDGQRLLVNVAEFDRIKGSVVDPVRCVAPVVVDDAEPETDNEPISFVKERARRMACEADLKELDLQERLGQLVPITDVERATETCGEAILRMLDQMASRAEDNATAVAKDGVAGARAFLKNLSRDLRSRIVEEFAKLPLIAAPAGETADD